ncbi:LysR family transcriptional regulator [Methylobacterium sp. J-077]|uniref:LysR family transcriptional regulator n=1 Tax=Methylobacterium sp. J-077 TaxID=2836656 RepID=UPI001FB88242|nr:LysR family transcriptional regulator [Methylobacterium sp. J-077]MCJ2126720.1 LysR family transcriptional regulator [Methylobacterium sp. J-077]
MNARDPIRERLPQLGALRVFESAARHGSLTRAAEELHVTHGAVSKQIRSLEADLGEALFVRRNRGVFLTERGRALAARLQSIFGDLHDALADFRSRGLAQPLVVSCEPTLCLKFLIPSLGEFVQATGIEVRVLAAGGRIDVRRDHVDLAIRRNDFAIDGAHHARVLCDEAMGPVCAPDALARFEAETGRFRLPALHTRSRPDSWATWKRLNRPVIACTADRTYEHFYLAIEAALAGQGVVLASIHMVGRDVAAGRLCSPRGFWPDGTQYVALSAHPIEQDERASRFVDWLSARMNATLAAAMPSLAETQAAVAQPAKGRAIHGAR